MPVNAFIRLGLVAVVTVVVVTIVIHRYWPSVREG